MEPIRILCYGDSNTWGYISGTDHKRYGSNERWTKLLAKKLGDKFEVIEEGLNGRTLTSNDNKINKEGRNGFEYLLPCLDTHNPIDVVIIMLGSNELKAEYNRTAEQIGEIFEEKFVKTILYRKIELEHKSPKLIIIAPAEVNEHVEYRSEEKKFLGAEEKSKKFNSIYKNIAEKNNCYFISNEELKTGIDGLHLTIESHRRLAELLVEKIKDIF